jgi:MEMO1 family protein
MLWKKEVRDPWVRPAAVAGQFYSSEPEALKKEISNYLSEAEKRDIAGRLVGGVVPHAGYVFSAQVAAHFYKQIEGLSLRTAIIIGASHHYPLAGVSVYDKGAFASPLGEVPIDEELAARLIENVENAQSDPDVHFDEHTLEVQIPFLKYLFPEIKIVPALVSKSGESFLSGLVDFLIDVVRDDPGVIIVSSTDLTHYPEYETAVDWDRKTVEYMKKVDIAGLIRHAETGRHNDTPNLHCALCGEAPVLSMLMLAEKMRIPSGVELNYANSGDVSGDHSRVVGYAAMAYAITGEQAEKSGKRV